MKDILRARTEKMHSLIGSLISGLHVSPEEERKLRLFVQFVLLILSLAAGLAIREVGELSGMRMTVLVLSATGQILALIVLRYLGSPKSAFRISLLVLSIYFLFLMTVGGPHGSRSLWMLTVPIYALFLLGIREGLVWTAAGFFASLHILFGPDIFFSTYPYQSVIKSRFLLTYGIIAVVSYMFEAVRVRYQEAMEQERRSLQVEIEERRRAEKALKESEQRLELSLKGADLGLWDWDLKTGRAVSNERATAMLGYSRDEVEVDIRFLKNSVHPEDWPKFSEALNGNLEGKLASLGVEHRLRTKSGEWIWVLTRGKVVEHDSDGRPLRLTGTTLDITERKQMEEALRTSEELQRTILAASPAGISQLVERKIVWANNAVNKIFGYEAVEPGYISRRARTLYRTQEEFERVGKALYSGLETGQVNEVDTRMIRRDGSIFDARLSAKAIDPSDLSKGVIAVTMDITARKEAERALQESERRYRELFDNAPVGIFQSSLDGRLLTVNPAHARMYGYDSPEEQVASVRDIAAEIWVKPGQRQAVIESALAQGRALGVEAEFRRKDGSTLVGNLHFQVVRNDDGSVRHLEGFVEDITERKRAEEDLRESEERYRNIIESIAEGYYEVDIRGNLTFANSSLCEIYGYSREESLGTNYREYMHKATANRTFEVFNEVYRTGISNQVYDYEVIRKDGAKRIVSASVSLVKDPHGRPCGFRGIVRDSTDLKLAEEAIRQSEANYRTIFDSMNDGILVHDFKTGGIIDVNARMCEMFGYSREEIEGLGIETLSSGEPPYTQLAAIEWFARVNEEGPQLFEWLAKDKDGKDLWVEVNLKCAVIGGEDRVLAVVRDITDRKQSERERDSLRTQLFQAQKMEAIGTLTDGIAHEFNNLLQVASGYAELILAEQDGAAPICEDLRAVLSSCRKGAELVRKLRTFAGKTDYHFQPLNLNVEVEQNVGLLSKTISRMIQIEANLADVLYTVKADSAQMAQLLMNLALNARDAMPDGGRLTIETKNVTLDEEACSKHPGIKVGDYAQLIVSDTGHGMDDKTLDRIFEPFFTSRGLANRSGLGLSVVHGIVEQHDGFITCESRVGSGTTFRVYFPAIQVGQGEQPPDKVAEVGVGGGTVLLVDDEELIADLGKRILTRAGYKVLVTVDGKAAIDLYTRELKAISLVVLDVVMPEMGGKKCLEELLRIDPEVKVLIAGGFVDEGSAKQALEAGAKGFVSKPYKMAELLRAVREVLK